MNNSLYTVALAVALLIIANLTIGYVKYNANKALKRRLTESPSHPDDSPCSDTAMRAALRDNGPIAITRRGTRHTGRAWLSPNFSLADAVNLIETEPHP